MEHKTIYELIAEYSNGTLSPAAREQLRHLIDNDKEARKLFRDIREAEKLLKTIQAQEKLSPQEAWENFSETLTHTRRKNRRLHRIIGTAIAASVALILLFIFPDTRSTYAPEQQVAQTQIEPGSVKAVLSYANGETVNLTSSTSSRIVAPDGSTIVNDSLEGLQYNKDNRETGQTAPLHMITVPPGGEYRFTLSDGTRVWINSSSEIQFPSQFSGNTREIYMKGEIYLEVAPDKSRPFIVHSGNDRIRVLGTKFNITAYPEEQKTITTLVSGSVEFEHNNSKIRLSPGEQSIMDHTTDKLEKQKVDVSIYTSWISGAFEYENMPLSYIARQLSRWYDVQFTFEAAEFREHPFTGIVKRNQTLEEVLTIIGKTTNIKFEISGRNIIIKKAEDAANISRLNN